MQFSQVVSEMNAERKGSSIKFKRNRKGLMQKTLRAAISLRTANGITPLGNGLICYADIDPTTEGPEAELIRSHVWKQEQVGRLWAWINGTVFPLAQVNPNETRNLRGGFVTQGGGQYVIDQ